MGLAVKKFFSMRPQLSFRFSVDINVNSIYPAGDPILGVCVKNVKVTTGEADTTKGATYYGDGYFTIPVYNIADKTLEVSFNETDDLYVLRWLDDMQAAQFNSTPIEIDIRITEYDETMTNEISRILYTCNLKEYSEPAFSRSGSVSFSTIDATFIIVDEINELVKNEADRRNELSKESQTAMKEYKPNSAGMEGYKPDESLPKYNRSSGTGITDNTPAQAAEPPYGVDDWTQGLNNQPEQKADESAATQPAEQLQETTSTEQTSEKIIENTEQTEELVPLTPVKDGEVVFNVPKMDDVETEDPQAIGTTPVPIDFELNKTEELPSNNMEGYRPNDAGMEGYRPNDTGIEGDRSAGVGIYNTNMEDDKQTKTTEKTTSKTTSKTYSLKDAKNEFKALKEQMHNEGVDTTSYAEVAAWLRDNNVYYNSSKGICATGVSLISNIVEDNDMWVGHGDGKNYNIKGGQRHESSSADINKKIKDLKAGESFIVSFDIKTGENKLDKDKSNREKYGHVVLVSKDKEGNLMYTSDFEQKSWQTYKDLLEWEKTKQVSLSVIDTATTIQ